MSKKIIKCCNCQKVTPNYGYKLCYGCHKKFKNGELEHPLGYVYNVRCAGVDNIMPVPQPLFSPESDIAIVDSHNHLALPFGISLHPAEVTMERIYPTLAKALAA